MKRIHYLFLFLSLFLVNSCQRNSLNQPDGLVLLTKYHGKNKSIKDVIAQLSTNNVIRDLSKLDPTEQLKWDNYVMYGSIGDTLTHLLIPITASSDIVSKYIHISLKPNDSLFYAGLYNLAQDYTRSNNPSIKTTIARDLLMLSKARVHLPSEIRIDSTKKLLEDASKALSQRPMVRLSRLGSDTTSNKRNLSTLTGEQTCTMHFQISYLLYASAIYPTSAQVNSAFMTELHNFLDLYLPGSWTYLNGPYYGTSAGNYNIIKYSSYQMDYATLAGAISQIWNQTVLINNGWDFVVSTQTENYIDYGCNDIAPGGGTGGGGTGGGGTGGSGDGGTWGYEPGEADAPAGTDCGSFNFLKTTTANWQESGMNNIRLKWVWKGGSTGGLTRTVWVNHIVYGLPITYANGQVVSPGKAAVIAARATQSAKFDTYLEFDETPSVPSDATVIAYFKTRVNAYMLQSGGTAGVTGSGAPTILFMEEIRSDYSDPYDCE